MWWGEPFTGEIRVIMDRAINVAGADGFTAAYTNLLCCVPRNPEDHTNVIAPPEEAIVYPFTGRAIPQYTILRARWCLVERSKGESDSRWEREEEINPRSFAGISCFTAA